MAAPARAALAALLALGLSACGSSSSQTASTSAAVEAAAKAASQARQRAESAAPKGSSQTLRAIYAQFPAPKPNPEVKHSAATIKAGIRACTGKTPLEVKEAYYPLALRKGTLTAKGEEGKMIAETAKYEKNSGKEESFTAGQLAADAYEATLAPAVGQFGYQGCVYALARRLEGELAPRG